MIEQSTATAEAKESVSNMSFEELLAQRTENHSEVTETEGEESLTEEETEEVEETETEETEEIEEPAEEEETEEEEPEIDLLSLTPEQIQELAKKGKSRLLQRIGELTAQKKALEEKLTVQADTKPLPRPIPADENPFNDLKTVEQVQAKYAELEKVAEETDRLLEDHEDYAADDVITLGDKEFTKKEIRLANRNARNAMLKFLPAQHAEIQKSEQLKTLEKQYSAAIPQEIPEMADESSDLSQQFKAMMADPLIEQVKQRVPDLAPQIGYILAHAVRSISRQNTPKTSKPATVITPKAKVPGTPFGAGAAKSGAKTARQGIEQSLQQFEKTGREEDWIAARIARI